VRLLRLPEGGRDVSAAEDFVQYKLQFVDYIQHDYEVIRPIVLFAETIAERSRQRVRLFWNEGELTENQ